MTYTDDPGSEGKAVKAGGAHTQFQREAFWSDTCREITQMQHASHEVVELYRQFGCRFCVPGRQQVTDVIVALDSAVPRWDEEHPELFYQTLELNYPELVKRS